MKYIHISLAYQLLFVFGWVVALFGFVTVVHGGGTYAMTSGEAVDLKWDSQNITDCRAANNYYTSSWGTNNITSGFTSWGAAPSKFGKFDFVSGVLTKPGSHTFGFNCLDDDSTTRFYDYTYVQIHPVAPAGLSNNSCNGAGTARTLSWSAINWYGYTGTQEYVVQVTKPAGQSCSGTGGTWSELNSTTCQATTTATSVTFNTTSGTSYSWRVASKAGSLRSANTSGGVNNGDRFTAGTNFSCTVTPSVQVNFRP